MGWGASHDPSPLVASGQSAWGARWPAGLLLALVSEGAPLLGLGVSVLTQFPSLSGCRLSSPKT